MNNTCKTIDLKSRAFQTENAPNPVVRPSRGTGSFSRRIRRCYSTANMVKTTMKTNATRKHSSLALCKEWYVVNTCFLNDTCVEYQFSSNRSRLTTRFRNISHSLRGRISSHVQLLNTSSVIHAKIPMNPRSYSSSRIGAITLFRNWRHSSRHLTRETFIELAAKLIWYLGKTHTTRALVIKRCVTACQTDRST